MNTQNTSANSSQRHLPTPALLCAMLASIFASILPTPQATAGVLVPLGGGAGVAQSGPQPEGGTSAANRARRNTTLRSTKITVICKDGTMKQVESPFKNLSDAEIEARLKVMRDMVRCVIAELKLNGRAATLAANCLQNLYDRNQLKIDLTDTTANANTETFDGRRACTRDEIQLSIRLFLEPGAGNCDFRLRTAKPDFSDTAFVKMFGVLFHESLHAIQNWRHASGLGDHKDLREGRSLKIVHQNEKTASTAQKIVICQVIEGLKDLRDRGRAGANRQHIARKAAADFARRYPNPSSRRTAINAALRSLAAEKIRITGILRCRELHARAYCEFVDGKLGRIPNPAVKKLNDLLRRLNWSGTSTEGAGSFGPVIGTPRGGKFVTSGNDVVFEPSNVFEQESADDEQSITVDGVDFISGAMIVGDGSLMLLVGGEEATGDGLLLGYRDIDGDGFFEPGTRVEAMRSSDLFLATLCPDLAAGQILAFNPETKDILRLVHTGSAAHPFPDYTEPRGAIGYTREDVRQIKISHDGLLALGASGFTSASNGESEWLQAVAPQVGGEFVPGGSYKPTEDYLLTPIFDVVPAVGQTWVDVRVIPGSTVCITIVFGPERQVIAKQVVFTPDRRRIFFGQALQPGYVVQIVDTTNGVSSVEQPVWDPVSPRLSPPVLDDEDLSLVLTGNPESTFYLRHSGDLASWQPLESLTTDGYGMAVFTSPRSALGGKAFFNAEEAQLIR